MEQVKKKNTSLQRNEVRQGNLPEFYQDLTLLFCASEYVAELSILITFCIGTVCTALLWYKIKKKKKKRQPIP